MAATGSRTSERQPASASVRGRLLRLAVVVPGVAMAVSLVTLALYCRSLLAEAAAGRSVVVGEAGFWFVVGGFLVACACVVTLQSVRLAKRVSGPEYRLRRALQRIRSGDVGFRIALRRGDLLGGLARECNDLLDWLNENPPRGARTGSDIVEVAAVPVVEEPQP